MLVQLTQPVSDGLSLLNDRPYRLRRIIWPRGEQLGEHLVAVGCRLRQCAEACVCCRKLLEAIAMFDAEIHQPAMKALQHGALALSTVPQCAREAVLTLERAVCRRTRFFEELVAEIAKPVPV